LPEKSAAESLLEAEEAEYQEYQEYQESIALESVAESFEDMQTAPLVPGSGTRRIPSPLGWIPSPHEMPLPNPADEWRSGDGMDDGMSDALPVEQRPSFKVPVARQTLARETALATAFAAPGMPEYPEYAPEEQSEFRPGPGPRLLMQQRAAVQRAAGVAGSRAAHKALVEASSAHRRDAQTAAADVQLAAANVELAGHSAHLANHRVDSNAHCYAAEAAGARAVHCAHMANAHVDPHCFAVAAGAIPPPFPAVLIDDDTQLRSEYRADARVPPTGHAGWRNNVVVRRSDQQHHRDHSNHIAADMYGGAAAQQNHMAYAQHHQQSMATHGRASEADANMEESEAQGGRSTLQIKLAASNAGMHNRMSGPRSMGRPPVPQRR